MSESIAIAEKHVKLSTRVKEIAESKGYHAGQVYIATHKPQTYRNAEQASGKEFWSIKAWMPCFPRQCNLKDPDLIITDRDRVRFFVEVKWGTVSGISTDLKMGRKEEEKIKRLLAAQSVYCNVKGPVSEPESLRQHKKFWKDEQTQFVLVTDLSTHQELQPFLDLWAKIGFQVTDSEKRVGRFPSLQEVLEEKK